MTRASQLYPSFTSMRSQDAPIARHGLQAEPTTKLLSQTRIDEITRPRMRSAQYLALDVLETDSSRTTAARSHGPAIVTTFPPARWNRGRRISSLWQDAALRRRTRLWPRFARGYLHGDRRGSWSRCLYRTKPAGTRRGQGTTASLRRKRSVPSRVANSFSRNVTSPPQGLISAETLPSCLRGVCAAVRLRWIAMQSVNKWVNHVAPCKMLSASGRSRSAYIVGLRPA